MQVSDEIKEEARREEVMGLFFLEHEIHFSDNYSLVDDSVLQVVHCHGLNRKLWQHK